MFNFTSRLLTYGAITVSFGDKTSLQIGPYHLFSSLSLLVLPLTPPPNTPQTGRTSAAHFSDSQVAVEPELKKSAF